MTELNYEQPLNEKIRSYLRLEYLSSQLESSLQEDQKHRCFYPLFALCELTERCDYRVDVLKDIDKKLQQIKSNQYSLAEQCLIDSLSHYKHQLQSHSRPGLAVKNDRFLSALRQRFSMPGACCNFDLPQLHYWVSQTWEQRQAQYQGWISEFECLLAPIKVILKGIREPEYFSSQLAESGFYQAETEKSLSLIRVKVDISHGCYPTISGHKNRYSIHFMNFSNQKHTDRAISFQIATCR